LIDAKLANSICFLLLANPGYNKPGLKQTDLVIPKEFVIPKNGCICDWIFNDQEVMDLKPGTAHWIDVSN
jgi:hypothetical protein